MPKGIKVNKPEPPGKVICDFCGKKFKPKAWNSRTCNECRADKGAPDQELDVSYDKVVDLWLKKNGRKMRRKAGSSSRGKEKPSGSQPKKKRQMVLCDVTIPITVNPRAAQRE